MKKNLTLAIFLAAVIFASAVSAMYYPTQYSNKIYLGSDQYMVEVNPGKSVEISQIYYPKLMHEQKVTTYPPQSPYYFNQNTQMIYSTQSYPQQFEQTSAIQVQENYKVVNQANNMNYGMRYY